MERVEVGPFDEEDAGHVGVLGADAVLDSDGGFLEEDELAFGALVQVVSQLAEVFCRLQFRFHL